MKIIPGLWLGLWVLMALWATACAQVFPTVQAPDLPTSVPTEVEQIAELPPTETPVEEPAVVDPTSEPTATKIAEVPTEIPPSETPMPTQSSEESPGDTTPRGCPELHATDPSTVNLASGEVQLVEFFAFW
jgi:hypothetical protein